MRKLGRKKSNREHLVRNLATSLILFEGIETTEAKAKMAKSYTEKIIADSKKDNLASRRKSLAMLFDNNAVKKIYEELIPRYKSKNSGFIKSFRLKSRIGDNAPMMRLELVDKKVFVDKKTEKNITEKTSGKKA